MPMTPKGKKVMKAMKKEYGEKKGKSVFAASEHAGAIKGVHETMRKMMKKSHA